MWTDTSVHKMSIGEYTLEALRHRGVKHIFGIPGDFTLAFCACIERSQIEFVVCRNELNAAYAAEGYARASGLGVVTATYDVGSYSALNGIALANAENTPLIMISGSPGLAERVSDPELHHKSGPFENQAETFRLHTASSAVILNPVTAFPEIDRVINNVMLTKRPGFIEIPRDLVNTVPGTRYVPQVIAPQTDEASLNAVVEQSVKRLRAAERPVIVAGVEIHRFGLQDELLRFLDKTGMRLAATLLSKSVIDETHPLFIGVYGGHMGDRNVARYVEESDCLLFLGVIMSDIDVGKIPAFNRASGIFARNGHFQLGDQHFFGVQLADYLPELASALGKQSLKQQPFERNKPTPVKASRDDAVRIDYVIEVLNAIIDDHTVVVCDIGDSLFASLALRIHGATSFFANAYYASMGHSIPAAVGVHFARPEARKVILCGDGAFQMTFQELSTAIEHCVPLIVIVLDNRGYETEKRLFPGEWKFNNVPRWNYALTADLFGGGVGYTVAAAGEYDDAIQKAWKHDGVSIIHVKLPEGDASNTLRQITEELKV